MATVRLTNQARADLRDIWDYLAREAGPETADAQLRRIQSTAEGLAQMPYSAQARSDLGSDIRSRRSGSYMIYYRPIDGGIRVGRVLHGRRDVRSELFE